jgi:hypothetical protein
MKYLFIILLTLVMSTLYAQETDSAKTENEKRARKLDDEDKMKWKVFQDKEAEEKRNPLSRIDSALRKEHEKRFKRVGKPN